MSRTFHPTGARGVLRAPGTALFDGRHCVVDGVPRHQHVPRVEYVRATDGYTHVRCARCGAEWWSPPRAPKSRARRDRGRPVRGRRGRGGPRA